MTRVVCLTRRDFLGVRTTLIITSFELLCLMAYSYPRVIRNLSCTGGVNVHEVLQTMQHQLLLGI